MAVTETNVETSIDLQLHFLPLALKKCASVIAVQADAKVILSIRMIESDISPVASEWADASLQKGGCQVSALITRPDSLRGVGRRVEGNSLHLLSLDRLCCISI